MVYYEDLDLLRGIGIALVLFTHSLMCGPQFLNNIFLNAISSFYMPMFFLISGFLYHINASYLQFVSDKFVRLMIPYIFNAAIICCGNLIMSYSSRGMLLSGWNISLSDLINGRGAWFIYALFFIFLVFPLIRFVKQKIGVIFTLILLIIFALLTRTINYFILNSITYNMIYFYIGYIAKRYYDQIKIIVNNKLLLVSLCLLFLLSPLFKIGPFVGVDNRHNLFIEIILALIGSTLFYGISTRINNILLKKMLIALSTYSLAIYLMGGIPTSIVMILINYLGIQQYFLSNILIFTIKSFCGYLIIKYLLSSFRITRLLFGIRNVDYSMLNSMETSI
jgi:fucose 4-O-acetylase-like acetyltransferase